MEKEKEKNKIIRKKVFENLILAIVIMLYFVGLNVTYKNIDKDMFSIIIKSVSLIILFISIVIFEIAYHKDSGKVAITAIELLILAIHALTSFQVVNKYNILFEVYIVLSTYAFTIYYVLKSIIIYTNENSKYLKSLSDIHEIVQTEPIKKEAKRKNVWKLLDFG